VQLKKLGNDSTLHFWKGFSLQMEGEPNERRKPVGVLFEIQTRDPRTHGRADRLAEGQTEMQTVIENRDVTLCCSLALIAAHKRSPNPDKEAIQQLEVRPSLPCQEVALCEFFF
jgi:hypothetical protein